MADIVNSVLSDVHLNTVKDSTAVVRVLDGNEIYVTDFFISCSEAFIHHLQKHKEISHDRISGPTKIITDDDGDILVPRRRNVTRRLDPDARSFRVSIHHSMDTKLSDVGLQVWMGALVMVDYIIEKAELLKDKCILELGGGSGLPSLVAGTVAKNVTVTDVGDAVLRLCEMNYWANVDLLCCTGESFQIKELDWTKFSRTELKDSHFDFIIACEVIYDDEITDAFFRTLHELLGRSEAKATTVIISLEKRLNFTMDELDVTCKEYDHFQSCLKQLKTLLNLTVQQIDLNDVPRHSNYNRTTQLELWTLHNQPSEPVHSQLKDQDAS